MSAASYIVAALFWIAVLWRLRSALFGDARRRAVWLCMAAFASVWTLKTPAVDYGLDHSGINDLSSVIKHVLAIGGIYALLTYVLAMYGSEDETSDAPQYVRVSRAVSKIATKAAVVTVVGLILLFSFAIDRSRPTEHFITGHSGDVGMAIYMSLVYLYMGMTAVVCAYQWGSAVRRTPLGLLKAGLALMCASMIIAIMYALLRTAYVIYAVITTPTTHVAELQESVTESLSITLFPVLLLGLIVPAQRAAVARIHAIQALRELRPLWRDMALAVPGPVMLKPSAIGNATLDAARDVLRQDQPVQDRVVRWVHEIRDAFADLAYYGPTDLHQRAQALAPDDPEGAEALWARAALAYKLRGDAPGTTPASLNSGGGNALDTELPWLRRVSIRYQTAGPDAASELMVEGTPA